MNRKTIILCVTVTGVFILIVAVALFFLYSGTEDRKASLSERREYMLFSAVPSDASMVLRFDDLRTMTDCLLSEDSPVHYLVTSKIGKMVSFLQEISSSEVCQGAMTCSAVLSVHNIGELAPLLLLDAGRTGDGPSAGVDSVMSMALRTGLSVQYADASDYVSAGSPLRKRALLLVSPSDILVQSSLRHLRSEVSVLDVNGVPESVEMLSSGNMMIIPESGIGKIADRIFSRTYRGYSGFISRFADCTAFSLDAYDSGSVSMTGRSVSGGGPGDFMNVYSRVSPSVSEVSSMLPSYTICAAAVPVADVSEYTAAYLDFVETRSLSKDMESEFAAMKKKTGISPEDWAAALGLKEVAAARFTAGGSLEKVLLAHIGRHGLRILLKGNDGVTEDDCQGKILDYAYQGYLSSLFGDLFSAGDETHLLISGDWIVIGSSAALSEYTSGRATDYTLKDYITDAAIEDGLSARDSYFVSYMSLAEDWDFSGSVFTKDIFQAVKASSEEVSYEPVFFSVTEGKSGLQINFDLARTVVLKSQAPTFERDTEVTVPEGPFRVRNSGTGKMNLFYQQENLYLCLQEENGKGLWGVPFKEPICGCAQTVDYYANGKLQILFAAGSKLYLIDRLGRFVSPPFPVDLGKRILLGPDAYDFSGNGKYNVMVLHTDNTIEMYNLQGRRPADWKTITSKETIKGLPERIRVGGRSYWVVRTSIQTLIFGFYGGTALTSFTGDRMIRPDSEITPAGDNAVEAVCYDGRRHTIRLTE